MDVGVADGLVLGVGVDVSASFLPATPIHYKEMVVILVNLREDKYITKYLTLLGDSLRSFNFIFLPRRCILRAREGPLCASLL